MKPFRMRIVFTLLAACYLLSLVPTAAVAQKRRNWPQWGQNPQHQGAVDVAGQDLDGQLADLIYDPFVAQEQAEQGGNLLVHYQVPLVHENDVFMAFKTGTFVSCDPPGSGEPFPCGTDAWNSQIWNEKRFHWEGGHLVEKWSFASDWKPEPDGGFLGGWEPVFHAVIVGEFLYVPGFGGTIFKLRSGSGAVVARINPFGDMIDPNTFVAGPLSADARGNVYYNTIQLGPEDPWSTNVVGSWLIKVARDDRTSRVSYTTLVPGAPTMCTGVFQSSQLPWPPSPTAQPSEGACGSQRPGLNVAPAIAPDGTIYTVSRAHFSSRYSYVVAVNPDLTPKWAASLRDHLDDGCGVLLDINPSPTTILPNGCRFGASSGVDPQTNQAPAGRVIDQSSSSPTVLPDGGVLYGAYTRYNYARGHLFKFSSAGGFLAAYDFGWDMTPAVYSHGGTYSIAIKDNHYDVGAYCEPFQNPTVCVEAPPGPFYITQLTADLTSEWTFQNTNTLSCSRNPDGTLTCVDDHPGGFEWCINAPAIDQDGIVYANSEDGNLYAIDQGGTLHQRLFLNLAVGAAYTPLAIAPSGLIYTENDGHLFAVGTGGGGIGHRGGHGGTHRNDTRHLDRDHDSDIQ
jgi:outer membrane protein assembly factor BamB